jgi:predicted nucleic acid-binding protein
VTVVLDSWAVLDFLADREPAAPAVARLLERERPFMSWVNLGEVYYIVHRRHGEDAASDAIDDLRPLLRPELPGEDRVLDAARLKADHRMSYADAFAAATAMAYDADLWTGDPELLVRGAPWRWRDLRPGS